MRVVWPWTRGRPTPDVEQWWWRGQDLINNGSVCGERVCVRRGCIGGMYDRVHERKGTSTYLTQRSNPDTQVVLAFIDQISH